MFPHLYYRTDSELMLQEVRGPELSGRLPGRAQISKLLRLHGRHKSAGERGLRTGKFQMENSSDQRIHSLHIHKPICDLQYPRHDIRYFA